MDFAGDAPDAKLLDYMIYGRLPLYGFIRMRSLFFVLCNGKREMRGQDIFCFFIRNQLENDLNSSKVSMLCLLEQVQNCQSGEMAYAVDSKSTALKACGFESRLWHHLSFSVVN